MSEHNNVSYFEFPCQNIAATKTFFNEAFGWDFIDYGPDYVAITGAGLDGGFYSSDKQASRAEGSMLVVMYSENLEQTEQAVQDAGGNIIEPIFSFPGGRRFHFTEPSGNEFAVWSDIGLD